MFWAGKKCGPKKNLWPKKNLGQQNFRPKTFLGKILLGHEIILGYKKMLSRKKNWGPKKFGPKFVLGQNKLSINMYGLYGSGFWFSGSGSQPIIQPTQP